MKLAWPEILAHGPLAHCASVHQGASEAGAEKTLRKRKKKPARRPTHTHACTRAPGHFLGLGWEFLLHLGRYLVQSIMSIQSDLTVAHDPRSNKTGLRLSPVNPSAISLLPHPFSTPHQARRATGGQTTMESRWTGDLGDACTHHGDDRPPLRDNGVRGATVGPFVGVRTHRRVDAPPSSGSMVVPTGSLPHSGVAPSM
jgi:hypothetical protein